MKRTILYVEDDPVTRSGVEFKLRAEGYKVVTAETLAEAEEWLEKKMPDLALLDLNLPDGNGLDLCRELHGRDPKLPILMLTARKDEDTAVRALSIGAVDFLRKPIGLSELVAKLKKLLQETSRYQLGELVLDVAGHTVHVSGKEVKLRRREFQILAVFLKFAGQVLSRARLQELTDQQGDAQGRTLDCHVSRLRSTLQKAGLTENWLESIYGEGYRLNAAEPSSAVEPAEPLKRRRG